MFLREGDDRLVLLYDRVAASTFDELVYSANELAGAERIFNREYAKHVTAQERAAV